MAGIPGHAFRLITLPQSYSYSLTGGSGMFYSSSFSLLFGGTNILSGCIQLMFALYLNVSSLLLCSTRPKEAGNTICARSGRK